MRRQYRVRALLPVPRAFASLTTPLRAPRSCGAVSVAALPVTGTVTAVEAVWNASAGAATLWLGSTQGLVQASWPQPHAARSVSQRALLQDVDVLTVSYDAAHDVLAVGGNASMHYQNRTLADLPAANSSDSWRADFISFPPLGLGAAVADVPTTLSWSPNGTLWIGNSNCLNARLPTLGGPYARIDGPAGLPMNNITSSAAASYTALRGPRGDTRVPASALRGDRALLRCLCTRVSIPSSPPHHPPLPFPPLAQPSTSCGWARSAASSPTTPSTPSPSATWRARATCPTTTCSTWPRWRARTVRGRECTLAQRGPFTHPPLAHR